MDQLLVNKKMARKTNKAMKAVRKQSLKMYGKTEKSIIKFKLGEFVECVTGPRKQATEPVQTFNVTKEEFLNRIREANLLSLSGNAFPVITKLETFLHSDAKEKEFIINGAECEPGLIHDQWLIYQYFAEIITGIQAIAEALGIKKVTLAAKDFPGNTSLATKSNIHLYKLPFRYPMGEEHILIRQVSGISIPNNEIPANRGILIMNVQTALSIYRLFSGEKVNGRYVTLADLNNAKAEAVYVGYGESIKSKLIELFGEKGEFYAGDGIFASHKIDEEESFAANISFACIATDTAHHTNDNKCKGCGGCQRVCPQGVKVKQIVKLKEKDRNADISALGIENCLHCNTCSFVCAANKNIFEYLK